MAQTVSICRNLTMAMLLGLFMLSMMGTSPFADAQSPVDCCLSYSKKSLPARLIVGYVRQFANELCAINAIIFYTRKGRRICANPDEDWVHKIIVGFLRKELKQN
ncbi:C-C motif chemokine 20-like [Scyliorhinus canicula]|uniref:C-C motif chemokine 20-like n=1 Tax=Scyliorhinus canicula TaxID=7830 RepID=UPI0018F2A415|nr:C-C motif chemokine 20-like [Scyliorhinus canicula]